MCLAISQQAKVWFNASRLIMIATLLQNLLYTVVKQELINFWYEPNRDLFYNQHNRYVLSLKRK